MELAHIFEKCLKLLPWLQDLHSFLGGCGETGSGKRKKVENPPVVAHSFLFIYSVT